MSDTRAFPYGPPPARYPAFPQAAPEPPAVPPQPKRVLVEPAVNSRLEALLTLFPHVKEKADAAKAELEELKAGIAQELARVPVQPLQAYDVPAHPRGLYPAMTRYWTSATRLDAKRIKEERPDLYDEYSVEGGHWTIRASG